MLEVLRARIDNHEELIRSLREEIDRLKNDTDPHWQWVSLAELKAHNKVFTRAYTLKLREKDWIEGIHWRDIGARFEYNLVPITHLYNNGATLHSTWLRSQKPYIAFLKSV